MTLRLGRETLIHFSTQVGVTLAGFIASFAIARVGGAEVFGLYSVAVAFMFWLNVPAAAIASAMTKRISEGADRATYLGSGLLLEGGYAVVVALGVVTVSPVLDPYITAPTGPLIGVLAASNVILIGVVGALEGEKRVALSGGLKTLERVTRSVLHVGLIFLGYGVTALISGHVVAIFVAGVVGFALVNVDVGKPSLSAVKSLTDFARYSWLGTLKTRAFGWMDTIVLASFAVAGSLIGVYEVAWNVASIFALVANSVQSTLFPEISELAVEDSHDRIHHLLNEGIVFAGVFMIPGLFGSAVLGKEVLQIYGTEFTQGTTIVVVLVFARMLSAYGSQFLNVANAVDRPDVAFRVNAIFVVTNLVLNVVLVWQYGWRGAAIATALSGGVVLVFGYRSLRGLIGPPDIPWSELLRQVGAASLMIAFVIPVKSILPTSHYVTILLVTAGAAVYTLSLVGLSIRVRSKAFALLSTDTTA